MKLQVQNCCTEINQWETKHRNRKVNQHKANHSTSVWKRLDYIPEFCGAAF